MKDVLEGINDKLDLIRRGIEDANNAVDQADSVRGFFNLENEPEVAQAAAAEYIRALLKRAELYIEAAKLKL